MRALIIYRATDHAKTEFKRDRRKRLDRLWAFEQSPPQTTTQVKTFIRDMASACRHVSQSNDPQEPWRTAIEQNRLELVGILRQQGFDPMPLMKLIDQEAFQEASEWLDRCDDIASWKPTLPTVELNDIEKAIVRNLGAMGRSAKEIAAADTCVYKYDSNFKGALSALLRHGILEKDESGYKLAPVYRFLLLQIHD